jgi:molybdopterin-guanine dinucleotide biosynthesis protein MobB
MRPANAKVPVLGFAAISGTGKTTLLRHLLALFKAQGLRIGVIKHTHHPAFDVDQPGKDSYELRHAGAAKMLIASRQRWALMVETPQPPGDTPLAEMLALLPQDDLDFVLVEGMKHEAFSKIELHRPSLGHPPLFPHDPNIIAVAADAPLPTELPVLDLNDPARIAGFVLDWVRTQN